MKIRDIVAIMAVALTAGSCNSTDDGLQPDDRVPIQLKAKVLGAAAGQTRTATVKTTQDEAFLGDGKVDVYIRTNEHEWLADDTHPLQCAVDGSALNPTSSTATHYYPSDGSAVNIYAVRPSYTSGDPFSVLTDQTNEADYAAGDLCYSPAPATPYSRQTDAQELPFYHALSKIVVKITTNASYALPSTVKLMARKTTSMTWTEDGEFTVPTAYNATGDLTTITMGMADDASSGGVSGGAIIPPQTIAKDASFISFTVAGLGPMIYPLPAATTFASGKRYTYYIKVDKTDITVKTEVDDWGTKVAEQVVLGKKSKKMLNPLWYVAEYNINSDLTFNTTESTSQGYLFQWDTGTYPAMSLGFTATTGDPNGYDGYLLPNPAKTVSNGEKGATWHLPTVMEWYSIVPVVYTSNTSYKHIFGNTLAAGTVVEDEPCTFGYSNATKYSNGTDNEGNVGIVYKSYWSTYSSGSNLRYAIRFLGTDYCSVWKYQYFDYNTTSARLVISSRLIPPIAASNVTALSAMMTTIMQNTYNWSENESIGAIQREFYMAGYAAGSEGNAPGTSGGQRGLFWATLGSSTNSSWAWNMTFGNGVDYLCMRVDSEGRSNGRPVRLFRDN